MKETIFFAIFDASSNTKTNICEQREYFQSEKTLKEFHDWLEVHRNIIKSTLNNDTVITDIQFIKLGY